MTGAFLAARDARMRMTFSGEQAKVALGGLLTSDVVALTAGGGQRGAALTPKGRVIALCRVFDRRRDLLVDADATAAAGFTAMIRKFVNPRLAKYAVVTDTTGCVGVHGEGIASLLAPLLGIDANTLESLPPLSGTWSGAGDDETFVVRSTELSVPGFDLFGARARIGSLRTALAAAGLGVATEDALRAMRVEAGVPEWGVDMDAETIPQEAVLDEIGAISFDKGCYTGQEVVARIHFRGHVNRLLRRLVSETPLTTGSRVVDAEGKEIGDVRSSVISSTRGPLAIAMVRREIEPGGEVLVTDNAGSTRALVERMP